MSDRLSGSATTTTSFQTWDSKKIEKKRGKDTPTAHVFLAVQIDLIVARSAPRITAMSVACRARAERSSKDAGLRVGTEYIRTEFI